ncbi:MAG TPA: DUF6607 family protein [Burkholderiales bacterium]|nr:DUF6607 family protein [Burkholderiales bacterium]
MRLLVLLVIIGFAPLGAAETPQFIFAWPLGENALKPRGASTRGAPVVLDSAPSEAWMRLRESRIPPLERDRRAILAMAGPYRVSFDFLEVVRFDPSLKQDAPYQSWATEHVFVAEDRPDFIALQHILAMRVLQGDGKVSEPMVVRHWRQEWRYQADRFLAYEGTNRWAPREVPAAARTGAWVQSVYQVDDSPRYAARGRWEHTDGMSTWISDETWRPLPRREFSVRNDYDVLVGTNRHTITATGWVQEENNLKLVTGDGRYLSREYGIARYERIRDFDFSAAERHFARTEPFWAEVRAAWRELGKSRFTLRAQPDQAQLFMPFFEYAAKLDEGEAFNRDEARAFVKRTLQQSYLTP